MSYIGDLSSEELRILEEIANWGDFINPILNGILPNPAFDNVYRRRLELSNKIIRGSAFFTRKYNIPIVFSNCYFEGNIVFSNAEICYDIVFRNCYCDAELSVRDNTIFHQKFSCSRFRIHHVILSDATYTNAQLSFLDNCSIHLLGGNHKDTIFGFFEGCELDLLSLNFSKYPPGEPHV